MELYFKHIVITTMHKDVVSSSIENSSNINGKIKKGKQAGRQAGKSGKFALLDSFLK